MTFDISYVFYLNRESCLCYSYLILFRDYIIIIMVTKKSPHPVTQKRKVTSAPVTQKGKLTRSQKAQQDLAREKSIREESIEAHSVSDATSTNETSSLKEQLAKKNEELTKQNGKLWNNGKRRQRHKSLPLTGLEL